LPWSRRAELQCQWSVVSVSVVGGWTTPELEGAAGLSWIGRCNALGLEGRRRQPGGILASVFHPFDSGQTDRISNSRFQQRDQ
jgi:hypothetical protein